jgi:hypothetical protein
MKLYDWSTTAALNETVDTLAYWPEGQLAATFNDSARGMMARLRAWVSVVFGGATNAGAVNAYTIASPTGHTLTAYTVGVTALLVPNAGNTGAVTLAIDGLAATPVLTRTGAALQSGDLATNGRYRVTHDGAAFRLLAPVRSDFTGAFQALDATLTALAGVVTAADKVIYATGVDTFATADFTPAGRSMAGAASAAAQTALLSNFVGDSGSGGTKGLVPAPTAGQANRYLKGDGTWSLMSSSLNVHVFASSGTWTKPAGAQLVIVDIVGGGGGGGGGGFRSTLQDVAGGSGGGGGKRAVYIIEAASCGSTEAVTIGTGGSGGAGVTTDGGTNGVAGGAGGASSFGSLVNAFGGGGGFPGANGATAFGGGGGGGEISAGGNATGAGASGSAGQGGGSSSIGSVVWGWGSPGFGASGGASGGTAIDVASGPSGGGGGAGYNAGTGVGAASQGGRSGQVAGGAVGGAGNTKSFATFGSGGGGGAAVLTLNASGQSGGAGARGGGGGGGGAKYGAGTGAGGAGGAGGNGYCIVYTWCF